MRDTLPAGARPLAHLHAVITGGGKGIGAAIAEALASAGADVTLMGRDLPALEAHATSLAHRSSVRSQGLGCDVSDPASVTRAFGEAAAFGPVAILINNAGQSEATAVQDITLDAWNRIFAVNVTGTLVCIQQALPGMVAARAGRIVNIASTAGLKGYAKVASYCASKHAVVGLTRALAIETATKGITVNAVCPGYTEDTAMFRTAVSNVMAATQRSADDARAILARTSPRGALVTSAEVANAVLWLCSPGASGITGQAIAVDGGETAS